MPDWVDNGSIPARQSTAVIFERLRTAILGGEIEAGAILSQVQIAKDFGVSRGPVREALRLLEREGLIDAELNRRGRVRAFTAADLEQLYATRIVIECLGLRLSVRQFSDQELDALSYSLERMDALAGKDVDGWEEIHKEFHASLLAHGGEYVRQQAQRLLDHSERYRRVYLSGEPRVWSKGASEHAEIVDACRAGDEVRAAADLARHLSRTALTVLMAIAPEHDPASVRTAVRQVLGTGDV